MAVTGVFGADFSKFDAAVEQSQARLKGLETAGGEVTSSLRLMTQSQEQMLDKIGAAGGRVQDLGEKAAGTGGQVKSLSEQYRQFDGVLQAAGVNIGPQVKGLEDIANAAGKTTTELGLLGTAGLAAGAFMTGWKIGEFIDGMTGASTVVENLARSLMGLEPAMSKAAGEQLTINKALEMGAKAGLTYQESLKFIEDQNRKNADTMISWRDRLGEATREVNNMSDALKAEIAIAQEAGATTEQITNKYGVSAQALEILANRQKEAAAAAAAHTREVEAQAAALEKAYAKLMSDVKNANQLAIMEADAANASAAATQKKLEAGAGWMAQVNAQAKANTDAAAAATAYASEQEALTAANDKLWQSVEQIGDAHVGAGGQASEGAAQTVQAYQAIAQQVEITSDGVRGWLELMEATNRANAILMENSLFTTSGQLNRIAAGNTGGTFSAFSPPSFASGIENFGGGLAKVHGGEVLANLPAGTSVYPRGAGLGANISNVFNLVDTESNLARKVSDMIMRQIRAGTQLGTA